MAPWAATRDARLGLGGGGNLGDALFAEAGSLAGELAQVVELRAPHAAPARQLHALDAGRVQREGPLHPDAVGDPADGEGGLAAFPTLADHHALEELGPLLLALDDLHVHAHGVARLEAVAVLLDLPCLHQPNGVHDLVPSPFTPASRRAGRRPAGAGLRRRASPAPADRAASAMFGRAPASAATARYARGRPRAARSAPGRPETPRGACTAAAPTTRPRTTRARPRPRRRARRAAAGSPHRSRPGPALRLPSSHNHRSRPRRRPAGR